jgi:hypothetical protein
MGLMDKMFGKKDVTPNVPIEKKQNGPIINQEEMDRISNELIKKVGLEKGKKIYLILTHLILNENHSIPSSLDIGDTMEGELNQTISLGRKIDLTSAIPQYASDKSNVKRVYEKDGKYLLRTEDSVYEIKSQEQLDEISNKLIKEYGLDAIGKDIRLVKKFVLSPQGSSVKSGEELLGKLMRPVALGESIDINYNNIRSNTSGIERVYEDKWHNRLIKTQTSLYELMKNTGSE